MKTNAEPLFSKQGSARDAAEQTTYRAASPAPKQPTNERIKISINQSNKYQFQSIRTKNVQMNNSLTIRRVPSCTVWICASDAIFIYIQYTHNSNPTHVVWGGIKIHRAPI